MSRRARRDSNQLMPAGRSVPLVAKALSQRICFWESGVGKDVPEHGPVAAHGDVGAGFESQEISGVIVEDAQRHEFFAVDFDGSFEVELPELIGQGSSKALCRRLLRGWRRDASVARQDGGQSADRRGWLDGLRRGGIGFCVGPSCGGRAGAKRRPRRHRRFDQEIGVVFGTGQPERGRMGAAWRQTL